jgi:hypothetical protein
LQKIAEYLREVMAMSIQQENLKYEWVVESGQVIKRFDHQHKVWIVLTFAAIESNAEQQLVDLLTSEYIRQQSDQ